jgi:hypothetical protein
MKTFKCWNRIDYKKDLINWTNDKKGIILAVFQEEDYWTAEAIKGETETFIFGKTFDGRGNNSKGRAIKYAEEYMEKNDE